MRSSRVTPSGTGKKIGFNLDNEATVNLNVASGKTLNSEQHYSSNRRHITAVVKNNNLLASHQNLYRNNVAQFIKDHAMGNRSRGTTQDGASSTARET